MSKHSIIIRGSVKNGISVEAKGVKGPSCVKIIQELVAASGAEITGSRNTTEFQDQVVVEEVQHQQQG